jgi:ubiquinone/menaquinone biosynthesis C-methylase UbiE
MMNTAETICYLLNRRARVRPQRAVERGASLPDEDAHGCFVDWYRQEFWPNDTQGARRYEESGSFLKRLEGSFAALEQFEKDFFRARKVLEIGSGRGPNVLTIAKYRGARFVYGVEIDEGLSLFSAQMLEEHGIQNAEVLHADMSHLPTIEIGSIDVVFSSAAFEHIADLESVLKETYRVLKPGGVLHASFSPIWRAYYGSHLGHKLPFPWTHLLFSEPTVRHTLERLRGELQESALYGGLNKMRLHDYRRAVAASPFSDTARMYQTSRRRYMRGIRSLPVIGEYFAGTWHIVAVRPD